ncbi:MAG: malate synthase G [Proteobacteria bacterium]|nr:malate synthase G [Pseudomonadota bacterium]
MNIFTKLASFFNSQKSESQESSSDSVSLTISNHLKDFLENEVLDGLDISKEHFWSSFEKIVNEFSPRNKALLQKREDIQSQIDSWHIDHKEEDFNPEKYKTFLTDIGYIAPRSPDFLISTDNVDPEIKTIAGPQLVVPVMNARFALNAANARWGSLYDALYGTDVISEEDGAEKVGGYNPVRGDKVIDFAKNFLDETVPLEQGSFKDVLGFEFADGNIQALHTDLGKVSLKNPSQYIGYKDNGNDSYDLLFKNNNLHFEIQIDPNHPIGQTDKAGIKDILMESAITTIQDCEDSVAAVDGEDKTAVYRNWLGLMKGDLKESFDKNGSLITRELNSDRTYITSEGNDLVLPGRSLMLVRNVGHLMTAMFTICIAIHDLNKNGLYQNSKTGSIYIVKPKMHGPEEVQFTCDLFSAVEEALGLPQLTAKVGIMDEERRTTVNLKECIEVAKDRVIFINTGFLDRTGDEIHTSMEAGPMITKADMKLHQWIAQYENWNVDIGLETGFKGRAQIGKGMWPMPDEMLGMYNTKTMHPKAGANCAWVPSPTAATLHAIHYHQILVSEEQEKIMNREKASLDAILDIPVHKSPSEISSEEIQAELENNCQGILGYVVRWVDQGVGCSKVPDINNVGLMEDRATCRISSQHIANWLHHNLVSEDQVREAMKKMALVVDEQNNSDPLYQSMAPSYDGLAFEAACNLAIQGRIQPSGYTEPILHETRLKFKS